MYKRQVLNRDHCIGHDKAHDVGHRQADEQGLEQALRHDENGLAAAVEIDVYKRQAFFQKVWVFVRARIVPWPQIFNS